MAELAIYDSQGNGIGRHSGQQNQRIKDLFFDGVRLAVDKSGHGSEIICFFRARESSASRSEQYYSVYTSQQTAAQAIKQFTSTLEQRIETEHDMSFVTTTEDTEVFEHLYNFQKQEITGTDKLDDVVDMLDSGGGPGGSGGGGLGGSGGGNLGGSDSDPLSSSGGGGLGGSGSGGLGGSGGSGGGVSTPNQAKVGIGSYREAIGVVQHVASDVSGYAITENADSTHLQGYEVVVEKGQYVGVELFDETQQAIDDMKKQRRKMLQPNYGATGGDDGYDRRLLIVGGILGTLIVGIALLFVACQLGVSIHDAVPGCGGGGDEYDITLETAALNDANDLDIVATGISENGEMVTEERPLTIEITAAGNGNASDGTGNSGIAGNTIVSLNRTVTVVNGTVETTVDADTLAEAFEGNDTVDSLEPGTHTVTIRFESASDTTQLERAGGSLSLDSVAWTENGTLRLQGQLDADVETPEFNITVVQETTLNLTKAIEEYGETGPEFSVEIDHDSFDPASGGTVTVEYGTATDEYEFEPSADAGPALTVNAERAEQNGNETLEVSVELSEGDSPLADENVTVRVENGSASIPKTAVTDENGESTTTFTSADFADAGDLSLSDELTVVAEYGDVTTNTTLAAQTGDSEGASRVSLTTNWAVDQNGDPTGLTVDVSAQTADGIPVANSEVNLSLSQASQEKLNRTLVTDGNGENRTTIDVSTLEDAKITISEGFTVAAEYNGTTQETTVDGREQDSGDSGPSFDLSDVEWVTQDDGSIAGLNWVIELTDADGSPIEDEITIRVTQDDKEWNLTTMTNENGINTASNESTLVYYPVGELETDGIDPGASALFEVTYSGIRGEAATEQFLEGASGLTQRTRYGSLPAMNRPRSEAWR